MILDQLVRILNDDPQAVAAIRELQHQADIHGITGEAKADAETIIFLASIYGNPQAFQTYCDFVHSQLE